MSKLAELGAFFSLIFPEIVSTTFPVAGSNANEHVPMVTPAKKPTIIFVRVVILDRYVVRQKSILVSDFLGWRNNRSKSPASIIGE